MLALASCAKTRRNLEAQLKFDGMTDNDLLLEIHRVREKAARECDCDVHKIGERMRQRECEEYAREIVGFWPG